MANVIQKALILIGASYLLNCGSTVLLDLAEVDDDGPTSSGVGGSTGGMGGTSVAWAKNVVFTYETMNCVDDVWAIVKADTYEPSLWPLVQIWISPDVDDDPATLALSPGATSYQTPQNSLLRMDNGDILGLCAGVSGEPVTVVLPHYVDE